ncbi:TetR/AcrR family transcriptional regulator [Brucella anthropi]|uniref:TetR/AcrR family transcriptional regulator n=1 Tax=Brucella anthropi TaxID=529 RepID=UPI002449004A|nr:TetR/AcrR family transcriptional regulator [Brucella anthropi]MDG9793175.1 TetR/AcrR family transcriptional regulator [Brucella anthropi]MDH0582962.1 TetR/AcrR family transcriptional regulator [Brucella anthropi]MDH0819578.1 TetR/AcrR family transcriptional regulator [Brucella anthropi]MDH2086220.1 TetR/AcrR family transcriptional regulator [Brucella anthropi]
MKKADKVTDTKSERTKLRRKTILRAAAELFFEQGYATTSIDAIIERTGGSKRTIYSEFGSKEGLFLALVADNADRAISALSLDYTTQSDLPDMLTTFGNHLLDVYMSPSVPGIYRIIITEAGRFPDLARVFYEKGPGRTTAHLAKVLQAAADRKEIQIGDPLLVAGHFVGMIRDNLHLQVVLGLRTPPTESEARATVASAVTLFLNGVRSR